MTEEHAVAVLKDQEEIRLIKFAEKTNEVTKKRKLLINIGDKGDTYDKQAKR